MEKSAVEINGENVEFYYQKKKIKNLILKVNDKNEIVLSIPNRISIKEAKNFIQREYSWVLKRKREHEKYENIKETSIFAQNRILYLLGKIYEIKIIPSQHNCITVKDKYIEIAIKEKYIDNQDYIKKIYEKWLKEYAEKIFIPYVEKWQKNMKLYQIPYPEIQIRKMKSGWGECIPKKKKIVLNLSLIKTDLDCIEYVIVHELAHFQYPNHSKNFYSFIEEFFPNWKNCRDKLNKRYAKIVI